MAATLTIKLNDEATPGLQELEDQLTHTADAAGETAADTRELTEAQREQITVIHEHKGAWIQLAASLINAGATAISVGGKLQQTAMWTGTIRDVLLGAGRASRNFGGGLASLAVRGGGVVKFLPRLAAGAGLAGAAIGVAAVGALALGKAVDQLGKKIEQSDTATDEQKKAFTELRAEADRLQISLEQAAARAGVELGTLGVTVRNNLNEIQDAGGELVGSTLRPIGDLAAAYRDVAFELLGVNDAWKELEAGANSGTKNVVENINALRSVVEGLADAVLGEGYSELARQQAEWNANLEATQENFGRLRAVNELFAKEVSDAAEARRIASLETEAQIDQEIRKERERAGLLAAQRRFDEQAQQAFHQKLSALEQQRTRIVDNEARERARTEKAAQDEMLRAKEQAEREALKRSEDAYNAWAKAVRESQQRVHEFAVEYATNANTAILNDLITRLEAEGDQAETLHHAKKRLIEEETRLRINAAETEEEREKLFLDGQLKLQREELAHRRDLIREEVAERKKAADEALAIERRKKDLLQQLLQDAGVPQGKDLLQQVDPRQALMDRRGKAAADAARRRVLEDPDNERLRTEALTSVGASNRLRRMQEAAARQAEREARAGAFRDFNSGQADPREVAQAQRQAGQQMLQTMQQNGQLSGDVVQLLQQQLQTAADQQGTLATLQQQVAQLQTASRAIGNGAAAQRQRAQRGGVQ